ncbi:fatty acyl-AMP ligase [Micromonospora sp. DT4]|uniref:fatty acyl-AMP ligase n=1 Tax=Micromonospora sp. DT4 TaxID=3393438 RepID=UPI003CE67600
MTFLPEILTTRAAEHPDRRAYVHLDGDGAEEAVLTYGELHARASAVAEWLTWSTRPGDRAVLLFPPGLDFIAAYFGCLYAGVIAVPVNRPRTHKVQDVTLGVIRDCEPSVALTVSALERNVRRNIPVPLLAVDELGPGDPAIRPVQIEAGSVAFLQYTSGSTSAPKGVMVTHGNLIANEEMIRRNFGHDERSTVVGWTPLYHDQGLIGNALQPLFVGATSVLMSPMTFLRNPLRWLTVISQYRARTSGGPNFAYEACLARAAKDGVPDVDLSSWTVAYNGAEPLRSTTLTRFAETFGPVGFRAEAHLPCYGLAEATLLVSGSGAGRGARTREASVEALGEGRFVPVAEGTGRTLVGSGTVAPGQDVRIVDPATGSLVPPDRVGEVWVTGPNVAGGYWRRPAETTATFRAELPEVSGRTYLRTGDLGLLLDGELYIVGRVKDMIIIRGRNFYPHDIEDTVRAAHPALASGPCAAFAVDGPDGEQLVVIQEIGREQRWDADPADIGAAIRAAVVRDHEVAMSDLVLVMPSGIQQTSSGKIMRRAARTRYLAGAFDRWEPR